MKILCYDTPEAWADAVAARFVAALSEKPALRLCLPTGATPLPASRAPRRRRGRRHRVVSRRRRVPARRVRRRACRCRWPLRCDAPARAARSRRPAGRALSSAGSGGRGLAAMCEAYDAAIDDRLDLTLLGIGTNGHIGMNEPGSSPDSQTRRVDARTRDDAGGGPLFRPRSAADLGRDDRCRPAPRLARDLAAGDRRGQGRHRARRAAPAGVRRASRLAAPEPPQLHVVPRPGRRRPRPGARRRPNDARCRA